MAKSPSELYAEILGDVFKEARERTGMSQKKLSEKSGVGRTGVVNLEAGKRNISILIGQMLADGMGVSYSDLIEEVEKRWKTRKR
ncbi:MAG: helix-turn-helix domain-containing protein [Verrucomicrobiaceae bacterium]|nr:helix-turn-helix domain-containing protein [Verrucomicrobiaceae bacterium]